MNSDYKNTKIKISTMEKLHEIKKLTGEKMIDIIDRLITADLNKTKQIEKVVLKKIY